jgi:hypothetical protein
LNAHVGKYELYRVVTDYEALQDGFLDRIEDLNTTFEQVEAAGEIPRGHASRMLMKSDKRVVKAMGPKSLKQMLKGTGLVLALIVDDERFAPLKEQMVPRKRPAKQTNVSMARPGWLFTKRNAANMRALGVKSLSPQQRKRIAKKAAKARWRKAKSTAHPERDEKPLRSSPAARVSC